MCVTGARRCTCFSPSCSYPVRRKPPPNECAGSAILDDKPSAGVMMVSTMGGSVASIPSFVTRSTQQSRRAYSQGGMSILTVLLYFSKVASHLPTQKLGDKAN
uniref:Uncharacterized protein n=1 Tax=Eutreptiella gymnastica TaxID=73025 RepID=A0A7S1NMA3_9EUGL